MAKAANNSLIIMLLSVGLAGVLVSSGITGHAVLADKTKEQTAITEAVVRWKRSFRALAGTQEQWDKVYKPASSVRDQLSLFALLNLPQYGLRANTDAVVLRTSSAVTSNNVDLALTKLCLATGGESFVVEAENYDALLRGLSMLSRRADVHLDNISILGEKDVPQAKLGDLCVYLRSE